MIPIIQKPVNWVALRINWLVSISWETLAVNGLKGAIGFLMIPGEIEVN